MVIQVSIILDDKLLKSWGILISLEAPRKEGLSGNLIEDQIRVQLAGPSSGATGCSRGRQR